jgi:hypothetical protein
MVPFNLSNCNIIGAKKDTLKISYKDIAYMQFNAKDLISKIESQKSGFLDIVG